MKPIKILYAVQATGNGHIARAVELLPHLSKYGKVDVFLSGNNSSLRPDLPVRYRSKGLSLFYKKNGGLDKWRILLQVNPFRIFKEAKKLPVKSYDLVIVDYEYITTLACKLKRKQFWHIGHQASFDSPLTPRPLKKEAFSEWILKNYCKSSNKLGFHFESYEDWILPPIIKQQLWDAKPSISKHFTVYLPHYSRDEIRRYLYGMDGYHFEIFSKDISESQKEYNLNWKPISNEAFTNSLLHCKGLITGAGFETPAEALFLDKPMIAIPIKGQYEQYCNAAALEAFGVLVIPQLDIHFNLIFTKWAKKGHSYLKKPEFITTEKAVNLLMNKALA